MKVIFDDLYRCDDFDHVFPISKYGRVFDRISGEYEGIIDVYKPQMPSLDILKKVHEIDYLDDLFNCRKTLRTDFSEFPFNRELIDSFKLMAGGTITTFIKAYENNAAFHVGGGFHHAFSDHAEGFCYLNDIAIGIAYLKEIGVKSILVIDLDVHQGNGTARIFEDDEQVFTFSIHQENNYPKKEKGNLDIGLQDGIGNENYIKTLSTNLNKISESFTPEITVYVAGVDVYYDDVLGGLSLSKDGIFKRDQIVFDFCNKINSPVAVLLAGGYSRLIDDTVDLHFGTFKALIQNQTN